MDLTLFIVFVALSLVLIVLGFWRTEHTELPLVGFFFLFLMGLLLINNDVQYKVGTDTNTSYIYTNSSNTSLFRSTEIAVDQYAPVTATSGLLHQIGYWVAVVSAAAFAILLFNLRRTEEQ